MGSPAGRVDVLLVDDNADVAEVTAMHLERQDEAFDVRVETGVEAALDVLDDDVDCVVSDYEMPGKDGLDLLRAVRDDRPTLPFVLFTGRGNEEIASEAISAGVTDYLQKGTSNEQYAVLANRIRNAVEHRRTQASARESESRYRTLLESLPNPILVHDGSDVVFANDRLLELLQIEDRSELAGRSPIGFVHPADRSTVSERASVVLEEREDVDWAEYRIERSDGEVRWVESRAAPVKYEGRAASQVLLRDVTERRRRERQLERLHEATADLFGAGDPVSVARVAVETAEDVLDQPVAAVWAYDPDTRELEPLAASDRAHELAAMAGFEPGIDTLPESTVEVATVEAGQPRVVEGYGEREDTLVDVFETMLLHPLDGLGLLSIGTERPRSFGEAERDLIGILARSTAAGLRLTD